MELSPFVSTRDLGLAFVALSAMSKDTKDGAMTDTSLP